MAELTTNAEATTKALLLDVLERLDRLQEATERPHCTLVLSDLMQPYQPQPCRWLLEGQPCPRKSVSDGRCRLHLDRANSLRGRGVSPGSADYLAAMDAPAHRGGRSATTPEP